ncbi:hypothetical protein EVAR_80690_1 [Eumeta japonica]|uniref:GAR domain-containing protein n=1 Tax=Eumeta variegata TaxID=151549 RepID=A0A4C1U3J5_EUMVA|nr:hypothetical protein EVAR_80690_1 [Eumeta japonica]
MRQINFLASLQESVCNSGRLASVHCRWRPSLRSISHSFARSLFNTSQVERRGPPTDADKIHDEVKRLVMLCTCRQKFRVFQVGEGKYRFGDSQKLRLVRILRSTVMVRVGGGWVALDEFLVKNDPCRGYIEEKMGKIAIE